MVVVQEVEEMMTQVKSMKTLYLLVILSQDLVSLPLAQTKIWYTTMATLQR